MLPARRRGGGPLRRRGRPAGRGSGSLLAAGRYALVLFPIARPLLALRRRPVLWYGYLAGALLLQAYLVVRFVNNLWVA